jgi:exopolyphosphatase/guanosine-5'-triphosphate,3'-diphosphate pyrophosphatase
LIRGVLSVGTNSTRALVADVLRPPRILLMRSTGTRIGEGLRERGRLAEEPMRRTLAAVTDHVEAIRKLTGDLEAIATSALRRADNGAWFAAEVERIAGVPLQIISGEEEARRSFAGAVSGLPSVRSAGVLDAGGGSSEYATGSQSGAEHVVSCEIGAVRLTEMLPELSGKSSEEALARARRAAHEATSPIGGFPPVEQFLLVGGTATTTIAVLRERAHASAYEAIDLTAVRRMIHLLASLDLAQRKSLRGMNPQRADILLAGLLIVEAAFGHIRHERALVTTNDLLLGTLFV